jgi:endogenous inhibitor of DNA gyrase (YacG/DUF329 family)
MIRCPTCGKPFNEVESKAMPFCSSRCQKIDLGRWYDERIGIPVQPRFDDEEESELPEGWNDIPEN